MKIGVCGTGTVASWISGILNKLGDKNIELYACTNSGRSECTEFAEKFHYAKTYRNYEELLQDPLVDVVYIAVPNQAHFDLVIKAIEAGKNVICEKPLAVNENECRQMVKMAKERQIFLMEALWASFLPVRKMVRDVICSGMIGEIKEGRLVQMDNVMFLPRVSNPRLGGGVLLDNGPYTIGWMVDFFGTDIKSITAKMRMLDSGVDAEDWLRIEYSDGRVVKIHQAMDTEEKNKQETAEIIGSCGKICFDAVANPKQCRIYDEKDRLIKELKIPPQIKNPGMPPVSGYHYEFQAAEEAIRDGGKECEQASHEKSMAISQVMTEARKQCGLRFPFECM